MRLPALEHLEPTSLEEACRLFQEKGGEGVKALAGGTDLLVSMKQRVLTPRYLVNLKGLSELKGIDYDERQGLKIGPVVTLRELQAAPVVQEKYPALGEAAHAVGATQHQFMGTVGGNLCLDTRCWYYNQSHGWRKSRPACFKLGGEVCHVVEGGKACFAAYQGDMASALLALGAEVRVTHVGGERTLPLEELFTGRGKSPHFLQSNDILSNLRVPPPLSAQGASYKKLRLRESIDFPLVGAAVALSLESGDGVIQEARVFLTAVGSGPVRVSKAEDLLRGNLFSEEILEKAGEEASRAAHPVSNMPASPDYRKKMAAVFMKRAAKEAYKQAKGNYSDPENVFGMS
jgi:4-hydroxybenzoyl-CoA reductase subunit beta